MTPFFVLFSLLNCFVVINVLLDFILFIYLFSRWCRFDEAGDFEEVILRFALNIWDQIEKCSTFSTSMDKVSKIFILCFISCQLILCSFST